MKKIPVSLIKYLSLLVALVVTTSHLFYKVPDTVNLWIILCVFAVFYIVLSVSEFLSKLSKSHLPYERFFYLPLSVLFVKIIKLGAFLLTGIILFISESSFVFLGVLVLIILFADLLVFVLRLGKNVYYISLFANYLLFALEEETKVFANQVASIEYRYDVFYLTTHTRKTFPIEIARLKRKDRNAFTEKFVLWAVCNKLVFTPEAKEKLADIISEAL